MCKNIQNATSAIVFRMLQYFLEIDSIIFQSIF